MLIRLPFPLAALARLTTHLMDNVSADHPVDWRPFCNLELETSDQIPRLLWDDPSESLRQELSRPGSTYSMCLSRPSIQQESPRHIGHLEDLSIGQVANASALSLSIAVRFGACTLKVIIHLLKRERLPGDRSACRGDPVPQRRVSVSVEATGSRCSGVSHTPLASPISPGCCSVRSHEGCSTAGKDIARSGRRSNGPRVRLVSWFGHELPSFPPLRQNWAEANTSSEVYVGSTTRRYLITTANGGAS